MLLIFLLVIVSNGYCDNIVIFYKNGEYLSINTLSNKQLKGNIDIKELDKDGYNTVIQIDKSKYLITFNYERSSKQFFCLMEFDSKKGILNKKNTYTTTKYYGIVNFRYDKYSKKIYITADQIKREGNTSSFIGFTVVFNPIIMREETKIENPIFDIASYIRICPNNIAVVRDYENKTLCEYDILSNKVVSKIYFGDYLKGNEHNRLEYIGDEKLIFGLLEKDTTDEKYPYIPKCLFFDIKTQKITGEFVFPKEKNEYILVYDIMSIINNFVILEERKLLYKDLYKENSEDIPTGRCLLVDTNGGVTKNVFKILHIIEVLDIEKDKVGFLTENYLEIYNTDDWKSVGKILINGAKKKVFNLDDKIIILVDGYLEVYDKRDYKMVYKTKIEDVDKIIDVFIEKD